MNVYWIRWNGTRFKDSILVIIKNYNNKPGQNHKNDYNGNPLTSFNYMYCQNRAYFTPDINEAKDYTNIFIYNQYNLRVIFMCRINPH